MAEMKDFFNGFLERTKEIFRGEKTAEDYDFTAMMNSAIGMAFVAKERKYDDKKNLKDSEEIAKILSGEIDSEVEECIKAKKIEKFSFILNGKTETDLSKMTLGNFLCAFRNSIAHLKIEPLNKDGKWIGVVLSDYKMKLCLKEDEFRKLLEAIANLEELRTVEELEKNKK